MNFPLKSSGRKSNGANSKKTLDIQHSNKLQQINEMKIRMRSIEASIKVLANKIQALERQRGESHLSDDDITHLLALRDEKLDKEIEYKNYKAEFDEIQYYTNTADILYRYYDLIEKGHDTNMIDNDLVSQRNPNTILKYFMQPQAKQNDGATKEQDQDSEQSRGTLLEKYMMFTDNNFVSNKCRETCDEVCVHCGSRNMTIMTHDGYAFCNECNTMEYLIIDHDKPSYKDPPKEISYFAYKRINHFQEFRSSGHICVILFVYWSNESLLYKGKPIQ